MKTSSLNRLCLKVLLVAAFGPQIAGASSFNYSGYGDILLSFRKTVGSPPYEVVVNIGNITNFIAHPAGSTTAVSGYSPSQLTDAFTDYNDLSWSVTSQFQGSSPFAGYPKYTIWYTVPRTDTNTQTQAPARGGQNAQGSTARQRIYGIGLGAFNYTTANADDTSTLEVELTDSTATSVTPTHFLTSVDSTIADLGILNFTIEDTTPSTFSSPDRVDLYQSVYVGATDPITQTNNGPCYFVGYFTLAPGGTMSFTRASLPAPPPPALSISRAGTTATISFLSTNNATYTLYYTNTLKAPVATWPASSTTITGNGLTNSFTDVSTDPIRFYRVGAH